MDMWATLHSVERSPAPRPSRLLRTRELVSSGLALVLTFGAAMTPSRCVSAAPEPPGWVRGVAGPVAAGPHEAGEAEPVSNPAPEPAAGGKPTVPGDAQRQGNVVAVFLDPSDPLIVISAENGYVTVRLRCGSLCPTIRLGDFVVAEGRRRSEAVFDASEVWVVQP